MSGFREFIEKLDEAGPAMPHTPMPAPTNQRFDFPNFHINPPPIGGYNSFSDRLAHQYGEEKPDLHLLFAMSSLIQTIEADPDSYATKTTNVRVGSDQILDIPYIKVVSPTTIMGGHGKLTGPQFERAIELGFARVSNTLGNDFFDIINIGKLRSDLWSTYKQRRVGSFIAQKVDSAMDAMTKPGPSSVDLYRHKWG